jgi:hypothetical protein
MSDGAWSVYNREGVVLLSGTMLIGDFHYVQGAVDGLREAVKQIVRNPIEAHDFLHEYRVKSPDAQVFTLHEFLKHTEDM